MIKTDGEIIKTDGEIIKKWKYLRKASGCGSVGRAVAPDTTVPRFKTSHRQILSDINCIEKTEIKKKRPGMAHLKKISSIMIKMIWKNSKSSIVIKISSGLFVNILLALWLMHLKSDCFTVVIIAGKEL